MKVARRAISVALLGFALVAFGRCVTDLRALQNLLPPGWEASPRCDGADQGAWGLCGPFEAIQYARAALVVTALAGATWCGVSFLRPARSSRPLRAFLVQIGASSLAYLAWVAFVPVRAISAATRTYQAYWLLPGAAEESVSAHFIGALWGSSWPMCGVTLCLLARGTLALVEVRRARKDTANIRLKSNGDVD